MTSYLVLFWYLSLRNSSIYSDPSVWGGSFTDEVRPLTAMKQYLKQIKRHFLKLDSCCFQLTQVLHLTTGGGYKICLGGTKKHGSLGGVCFVFFGSCQNLQHLVTDILDILDFLSTFSSLWHLCHNVPDKDWCERLCEDQTWEELHQNRQTLLVCRVWLFQLVSIPA